ncbi:putative uncharacterized protein [Phocaeicola dorei CAG:222]|nr:putative uncharacterized protein [Phocaeicola dorei CAG:222]
MPDICGIHRNFVNFMLKKQEPRLDSARRGL